MSGVMSQFEPRKSGPTNIDSTYMVSVNCMADVGLQKAPICCLSILLRTLSKPVPNFRRLTEERIVLHILILVKRISTSLSIFERITS